MDVRVRMRIEVFVEPPGGRRDGVLWWALVPIEHGEDAGIVHGGAYLIPSRSVLIVDQSEENRTVLRMALERQGVRILEATQAEQGLQMARRHQPDLIVVDLELDVADDPTLTTNFAASNPNHQTPLIVLGSMRRHDLPLPAEQRVSKPYHYAPLIRRIEGLLGVVGETTTP